MTKKYCIRKKEKRKIFNISLYAKMECLKI